MFGYNLIGDKGSDDESSETTDRDAETEGVEEEELSGNRRDLLKTAGSAAAVGLGAMAAGSGSALADVGSHTYQLGTRSGSNAVAVGERVTLKEETICLNFVHNGDPDKVAFWFGIDMSTDNHTYTVRKLKNVYWNDCCFDELPKGSVILGGWKQNQDYITMYYLEP